ncbi:MAG: hypothetical protein MUC96_06175 [Myxococcaceae bacterium]|nr:hypothetical protein [Myxococcaceae bacterium]
MSLHQVRQTLRISLARHRVSGALTLAVALATALVVRLALPETWRVQAEVVVAEPATLYRLTAPFDAVPRLDGDLAQLPELLTSKARLVALVKRTGLVDRWAATRSPLARLKDALVERVRGPMSDEDLLDALVAMVDQRLGVWVEGNKVFIACEWSDPQVARSMVEGTLVALQALRLERDVGALEAAARALDGQRAGVEAELRARLESVEQEQRAARAQGRWPNYAGAREQLRRDTGRASELWLEAANTHLRAEAMAKSARFRTLVTVPPRAPRRPEGPSPVQWALGLLVACLSSHLGGAVVSGLLGKRVLSDAQASAVTGVPVVASVTREWSGVMLPIAPRALLVVSLLGAASGAALALTRHPLGGLGPWLLVAAGWALWRLPLKWPLLGLLLLAVTVDDPTDRPYYNLWRSPLWPIGRVFFTNIAWFTGFELSLMGLGALTLLRRLAGRAEQTEAPGAQGPGPLRGALVLSFVTVCWLVVWGLARGGIFREALWQFRALAFLPLASLLALSAFRFPDDLRLLGRVLVVGSVVKALLGAYFMYGIAFPSGEYPPHTTGHNDTMVFVTGVVLALVRVWEWPSWRHLLQALLWLPVLALALKLNDRRIAYVDIAMALGFIYLVSPMHRAKRLLTQAIVAMIPVLLLYTAVGWNARGGLFKPVVKLRSIVAPTADSEEESSNVERDIENFNLLKSWERDMVFGQGFGHAFTEFIPSNDFSQSAFGHIGHNSVLWLLWIGGITGFFGLLLYLGLSAFFFARTLPVVQAPEERVALLVSMGIIITYLLQAFGDMGTQAMQLAFFVSIAVAIIGRLTSRYGRWSPAAIPLTQKNEPMLDGESSLA